MLFKQPIADSRDIVDNAPSVHMIATTIVLLTGRRDSALQLLAFAEQIEKASDNH